MTVPAAWRAIAVVVLAAASVRSLIDLADFCVTGVGIKPDGDYCANCLQPVNCVNGVATPLAACSDSVCEEILASANCVAAGEGSKCQCTSNQCDGYNSAYVDLCTNNDGMYDVLNCDDVPEMCAGLGCAAEVSTCDATASPGYNFSTTDCWKATYCRSDNVQISIECDSNEYIDDTGNCLPAPPVPCASGCSGLCPDNLNCSSFYYCDAGTLIQAIPCPAGEYFNPNAQVCEADPSVCARLTSCIFNELSQGDTTTPATTAGPPPCSAETAGNTAAGPCSSSYWVCRNIGRDDYEAVLMKCPDGLVFNPDPAYPFCVLPENVDKCGN